MQGFSIECTWVSPVDPSVLGCADCAVTPVSASSVDAVPAVTFVGPYEGGGLGAIYGG